MAEDVATVSSSNSSLPETVIVCTPERPTALTATVSDRPTPSRRFSSVRRSSAASRAPSPVATELDSDGSASPRGSPSHPRLSHPSPRKGGVSQDDLLMMLEAPEAAEEPKEAPKADQAPLLPDLSAVAAAKHRADAECLTAPEPVEAADAMEAEQAPGAPAPAAPAADAPEHAAEHEWLMGCVARPLEQLLFGDSPERSLRIHSRARELLETPPDESGTKAAKASSSAPSRVQPPSIRPDPAKRPRPAPPDPPKEPRPTPSTGAIDLEAPRPAALGGVPSTARPVERAERRAMWFLQTLHGGPQEREEISRLAEEDESMMNAALETALNALRRKGVTSSGPAAAAQLLNELGQAAQANLNGLCCVPLDSDLYRSMPSELLGDPKVSAARLPPRPGKGGKVARAALAGAALHRAKEVVTQILDAMAPVVFKIGITCTPFVRWRAYEREGYEQMHLLHVTEEPGLVQMLEAALISEFQARPGCRNVARGGEGPVGRGPYFAYLVVVSCGDGVGILPKRGVKRTACKTAARKKRNRCRTSVGG
ncbi:unnamed protein product [Durusdinium trenchii]|uniref:Uncharacterized protein n=1 Tax=Durusdinium trenchii TaxID=1381693 RepID=A0ABP0QXH3_9DINO